ncbi:MAG: hypothetical protein R6V59_01645, partial [Dehalococcoidia bacterium]
MYLHLLCEQIFANNGLVTDIAAIPKNIQELYDITLKRITNGGSDQNAYHVLLLLAEAKAPLTPAAMAELLDINQLQAEHAVDQVRELLHENEETTENKGYQLFHESLREWLLEYYQKECREMAGRLTEFCFHWTRIKDDNARSYALAHAAEHLFDLGDHEQMWVLMNDQAFRDTQIQTFKQYQPAFHSIQKAIDLYISRNGQEETDDPRLCWLVLRAGELGHQAKTDIHEAFEWIENRDLDDPGRIEDALERLSVLDEENFFKAVVYMLWLEADRQATLPSGKRYPEYACRILKKAERKIHDSGDKLDWSCFLNPEFMAWWTRKISDVFPGIDEEIFVSFIGDLKRFELKHFCFQLSLQLKKNVRSSIFNILVKLTKRIEDDSEKNNLLVSIVSTLKEAGEYCEALKISERIKNRWLSSKLITTIASSLAEAEEYQKALQTTERIE